MNREWEDFFQVRRLWLLYSQEEGAMHYNLFMRVNFLKNKRHNLYTGRGKT